MVQLTAVKPDNIDVMHFSDLSSHDTLTDEQSSRLIHDIMNSHESGNVNSDGEDASKRNIAS